MFAASFVDGSGNAAERSGRFPGPEGHLGVERVEGARHGDGRGRHEIAGKPVGPRPHPPALGGVDGGDLSARGD
eukprot:9232197-Lingulodinium_polyedra.AAC.1